MSEKTVALTGKLIDIARKAGVEILKIYNDKSINWDISPKEDGSPLTIADQKANDIICEALMEEFPDIPIVSEENKEIPFSERKNYQKFWLVDPLDGTKEFIKRNGEFTVNIALVEGSQPIAGVVYAPVLDEMFFAEKGEGAYKLQESTTEKLAVTEFSETSEGLNIVCSRSHLNDETIEFLKRYKNPETMSMGSSLKFMLVAEGKAQVYPRLAPTMEWDTAASQIIIEEAGGRVIDWTTKKPMAYNKEILRNNSFVVYAKRI